MLNDSEHETLYFNTQNTLLHTYIFGEIHIMHVRVCSHMLYIYIYMSVYQASHEDRISCGNNENSVVECIAV